MSQRVLVEFNLDMLHQIERYPEAFLLALKLSLGMTEPRLRDELKRHFGASVVAQRHHSTAVAVIQNGGVVWSDADG